MLQTNTAAAWNDTFWTISVESVNYGADRRHSRWLRRISIILTPKLSRLMSASGWPIRDPDITINVSVAYGWDYTLVMLLVLVQVDNLNVFIISGDRSHQIRQKLRLFELLVEPYDLHAANLFDLLTWVLLPFLIQLRHTGLTIIKVYRVNIVIIVVPTMLFLLTPTAAQFTPHNFLILVHRAWHLILIESQVRVIHRMRLWLLHRGDLQITQRLLLLLLLLASCRGGLLVSRRSEGVRTIGWVIHGRGVVLTCIQTTVRTASLKLLTQMIQLKRFELVL